MWSSPTNSAPSSAAKAALSPEQLAEIERDLTRHLGPIAKILVKRAAPGAASPDALRRTLADQIDAPAARTAFLAGR